MTPSWKFRSVPGETRAGRGLYEHPWPSNLPESCEICGTKFRTGFNLTHGAGRIGRILRKTAYVGFLPCLFIGFFSPGLFPSLYKGISENHSFWIFFGTMFIPPLFLAGLSCLMPSSRHVECKKCGWNRDYKPLPLPKLDTSSKDV